MKMTDTRRARAAEDTNPLLGGAPRELRSGPTLLTRGDLLDGHYEIRELLGAGGMAEVYLGFDRWLAREVAIKATPPMLGGHLEREARALARFRHPGLVTAHAYGHHKGVPYLVLEYLRGKSLSQQLIEAGPAPFSVDAALRLVVGICEALQPLHERGYVHCDLKPGNIMCTEVGVVLIDFGLVWDPRVDPSRSRLSGSPPFMSPELIAGDTRPGREHLVDIYALGMILYGLLAGATPFSDPDPEVVMSRQLVEDAPSLSTVREDLPPRLAEIVGSSIARDPAQRPSDAASLRAALLGIPRRGSDRR
jgi:serine/threonine-protein kinase